MQLYENNKSMSPAIRAQITAELGVEPVLINSALVSAQNRQRLYWVGKRNPDGTYSQVPVEQPEDRGIILRDILESGVCWKEKAYTLKASACNQGGPIKGKMLERETAYIADLVYRKDGALIVEDVKGYKRSTAYDVFVMKRKLMLKEYGIRVKEV